MTSSAMPDLAGRALQAPAVSVQAVFLWKIFSASSEIYSADVSEDSAVLADSAVHREAAEAPESSGAAI